MSDVLSGELAEALHGPMVPKFLATLDAEGVPNVVPVTSLDTFDGRSLVFGVYLLWKTRKNLAPGAPVAAAVMTEDLQVWTIKGRFREWITEGPWIERLNENELFRYNAYFNINRAGVIDVDEVAASWHFSTVQVAMDLVPARMAATSRTILPTRSDNPRIHHRIHDKLARIKALKVVAWAGATGPEIVPALPLWPDDTNGLHWGIRSVLPQLGGLERDARVAISVLTPEPVAYQLKGRFHRISTPGVPLGTIRIDQTWSASPPLAGKAIPLQ